MRITETAGMSLLPFTPRTGDTQKRQTTDVSREERLQLLTERMQSRQTTTASSTYSERAQLLSVTGSSLHSWVA